jgi:hypothetical protein
VIGAGARVIIAGAGWRVRRFVVPALTAVGVRHEDIVIARRHPQPLVGMPDVRVVLGVDSLPVGQVSLTVNCVSAEFLQPVQHALVARYPTAQHFCDTPIIDQRDSLFAVLRSSVRAKIHSLEDWPLMPNLSYIAEQSARLRGRVRLSVEHFGIPLHFIAMYRGLLGVRQLTGRTLVREADTLMGWPRPELKVSFKGPKHFPIAKIRLESADCLIEDFHEVESTPHANAEILYRVITGGTVTYFHGLERLSGDVIPENLIAAFQPLTERKNVHELDKFVGLTRLFRSVLNDGAVLPYPLSSAIRDTLTVRRIDRSGVCMMR